MIRRGEKWKIETVLETVLLSYTDEHIQEKTTQNMALILMRRRWKCICHVIRKDNAFAPKQHSTGHQMANKTRPKITWHRTVEKEMKSMGFTWGNSEKDGDRAPSMESLCCCPT